MLKSDRNNKEASNEEKEFIQESLWLKLRRNSDWEITLTKSQVKKEPETEKVKVALHNMKGNVESFPLITTTFFEPSQSCSVVSGSLLWPHGLCSPWDSEPEHWSG